MGHTIDTKKVSKCQTPERPSSKMRICPKTCSKTPSTSPPKPLKNTTSKKISPLISRRSSTRNTTQLGTVLLEGTLDLMSPTRPSTLFTSTWDRLRFFCSNLDNFLDSEKTYCCKSH